MKTETATQAKTHFGKILDAIVKEPVTIQKSGRSVAVIMSFDEYERITALEDEYWIKKAHDAQREGFMGADASEKLLGDLLS